MYNIGNMVKVAVVTRTKDRPVFLRRAIESVKDQSYHDYVHVIVNDGGDKDIVENVLASLGEDITAKIQVFHRPKASNGPDTIFNESIDRVDSEYVVIHDDDDTWHKDFLLRTVEYLDDNKDLAGVVVKTTNVVEVVTTTGIKVLKKEPWMPELQAISLYRQFIDNQLTPIAFLFRRSAYKAVGKFDDGLPVVGDWEFGIRLLQQYEVGFLDLGFALANYHHRKKSRDNSFAKHSHRKYVTQVANKYLREDLKRGSLGVGYIISDLKYRQDSSSLFIKKLIPTGILRLVKRSK